MSINTATQTLSDPLGTESTSTTPVGAQDDRLPAALVALRDRFAAVPAGTEITLDDSMLGDRFLAPLGAAGLVLRDTAVDLTDPAAVSVHGTADLWSATS